MLSWQTLARHLPEPCDPTTLENTGLADGCWLALVSLLCQDDDKSFRRAPSWRKKFRPKDIRGLASGSAETLPANFRVTSSMSSPSMQPKKVQMDGMWWALQPPHVGSGYWLLPGRWSAAACSGVLVVQLTLTLDRHD